MKDKKNDGGGAFPIVSDFFSSQGMTLRDYFAAVALQGIHASFAQGYPDPESAAEKAYEAADSMLAERSK